MKQTILLLSIITISLASYAGGGEDPPVRERMQIRERAARPDVPGTFLIELGWNVLMDAPESMEIASFGSRSLNLYYFYDLPIGKGNFVFRPGFGVGLDRYKFDNDVTLTETANGGDMTVSVDTLAGFEVKKSMLVTNYFDIPLEFLFYANPGDKKRSFKAAVGGRFGIKFSSHTKLKYDNDGDNAKIKDKKEFGLNKFRYGVTGRVGVGGFSVFYYHNLSELFESGNGPAGTDNTTNITVGLSFTGF